MKLGIDLGTTNTLVFIPKKGIILNEPTVVAVSLDDRNILAVGLEAKEMLGRTPDVISVIRPLQDGVIADYKMAEIMIRYFTQKATGLARFLKPEVLISVPAGVTSAERRAVISAGERAGAKNVYLVKEPILAAIGAGIQINSPSGNMILNIGGGTSEVAVISLGGIVSWASVRVAGNKIDAAIADYIRRRHNLAIGERTAEEIKIMIGSAIHQTDEEILEIRGRSLTDGLPKIIEVSSNEITDAISDELGEIIRTVKNVLAQTPPELSADIIDKGMILSGGGALLKNLDELIFREIGVPAYLAPDPLLCVAKGTGVILENLDLYKKALMTKR